MESLGENIYAAFGVFGFIIIGMGVVIKYLVDEKKVERKERKEERDANIEAIKDFTRAITSLEIFFKTKGNG